MNERLWQKNLIKIEPYVAGEQPEFDDIIKLNANENPYPPSPEVRKVLDRFSYGDLKKYPSIDARSVKRSDCRILWNKKRKRVHGKWIG